MSQLFSVKPVSALDIEKSIEEKLVNIVVHKYSGEEKSTRGKREEKQRKEQNKGGKRGRQRQSPGKLLVLKHTLSPHCRVMTMKLCYCTNDK